MSSTILSPSKNQKAPAIMPLSPSKRGLENRKAASKDNIQEVVKKVSCDVQMTFEQRIHYFKDRANAYKCMEDHPESKKIYKQFQSVISSLEKEYETVSFRLMQCTQISTELLSQNLQQCIDYTLLDSVPQFHSSELGVPESVAMQYYLSLLKDFYDLHPFEEIRQVIDALEGMFQLFVFQCEKSSKTSEKIRRPLHWYQTKVCEMTKKLQKGEIPYLFVPISTVDHALAGKIEWKAENGFFFTIINTGDRAKFLKGNRACDFVYPHLTIDEVNDMACSVFHVTDDASDIYRNLGKMLPLYKRHQAMKGRDHKVQSGNNCASQSLSTLIHGVLPSHIYWPFKSFATECAIKDLPPGERQKAATGLLVKRSKKIR